MAIVTDVVLEQLVKLQETANVMDLMKQLLARQCCSLLDLPDDASYSSKMAKSIVDPGIDVIDAVTAIQLYQVNCALDGDGEYDDFS